MLEVIKIGATWCSPCLSSGDILRSIQNENMIPFKLTNIDVDDEPDASLKYSVRSIPTVIVMKDGVEVSRLTGAQPKSKYENFIKSYTTDC